MNIVVLQGVLARPTARRELPSGDTVVELDVATVADDGRTETAPVVWADGPGWLDELEPGAELVVTGRVRRRFFRSGAGTVSRTEVVATTVVPARDTRRARKAVRAAIEEAGAS